MSQQTTFRIGSLFPHTANGTPNLILSSGYQLERDQSGFYVRERNEISQGRLTANLTITTDPVQISGIANFANSWLRPQLLAKDNVASIFYQYWNSVVNIAWPTGAYSNNLLLEALSYLGYRGYGWDKTNDNTGFWKEKSQAFGFLYESVLDLNNYKPELLWAASISRDTVQSEFDTEALLVNLARLQGTFLGESPLWLPSILFTYGIKGQGTSYPGPVLMIRPGEQLDLNFENRIAIPGLTEEQNQKATLIPNSSYGLNGGSTAGGMFSTNFHMHGGHVSPSGFGDNVVARYTSGQNWITSIDIPRDHGIGSYWYHPHYHPAVNTQLYGGLSGFMQVGDPLEKVPFFRDVPRNLAVLKTMQISVDPATGDLQLAAINGNILGTDSLAPNRASMLTINGEYKPTIDFSSAGWQALTLSNQDNNYYMNISIRHKLPDGSWEQLPLFIYGEDGHQYPQIRAASSGALGYAQLANQNATGYEQAANLISLPSGKRVDLLFYLPSGESEIVSSYSFTGSKGQQYQINNLRFQANQYVDLATTNRDPEEPLSGPGPIARFNVGGDRVSPSQDELNLAIQTANAGIKVQEITPDTKAIDYDNNAVPSVNLYASDDEGRYIWDPIRRREFNYEVLALVGPPDQRDLPTQEALANYELETGNSYQRYSVVPTDADGSWLGYENPDFINDHVFPNGPLIIAQLGTMEEWSLKNWNWGGPLVANGGYLVGHPFHIHVNDYQVKQSDTELPGKRNLEDVTMLNSSGYHYADQNGKIHKLDPLVGSFSPILEAFDYKSNFYANGLFTTGFTETTIRMLFQDFLGTYVHHCHLLEHEDAGMMQVVTVIENTDSSWLLAAEGFETNSNGLILRKANNYESVVLPLGKGQASKLRRAQVGDLSGDYVQDIILASVGKTNSQPGHVQLYDGAALRDKGQSKQITSFAPYKKSTLAPWAFNSDFTGDGKRELVTGGYVRNQQSSVSLSDFEITGWLPDIRGDQWTSTYRLKPWLDAENVPQRSINNSMTSFAVGDFNLDNFDDYAIAYLQDGSLRIRIIDGAAIALRLQSGSDEGGYFPDSGILSDVTYAGDFHAEIDSIALTTGFNSYAQSPIENLIVTASSETEHSWALTFQLDAGHFIATGDAVHGEMAQHGDALSSAHGRDVHGGGMLSSSHGHHGISSGTDVVNDGPMPLQLASVRHWHGRLATATPTFSGVLGQGALLVGEHIVISQGTSSNGFSYGNASSSDFINNSSQELYLSLDGINQVSRDDLTGIIDTDLKSTLSSSQAEGRANLAMLAYQAYTNQIIKPSDLALLAAGEHGGSLSVENLVSNLLQNYTKEISTYYGGDLERLSSTTIIQKAYNTLYRRTPTERELLRWSGEVMLGLSKSSLPIAILQATSEADRAHVALLSAGSRWSQIQWGTSAVIDGSFGQGMQSDLGTFAQLSQALLSAPPSVSWNSAQQLFDQYQDQTIASLGGTPISNTGFF